jgi:hypothetical protein
MEPVGSLPCSKQPATGPYPEPDESHPLLISVRCCMLCLRLTSGLFCSGFPAEILYGYVMSLVRAAWPACIVYEAPCKMLNFEEKSWQL